MRWGNRRLSAEVLDPRGRRELTLGDRPGDDIAMGSAARLHFTWREGKLEARFSAGVLGEAALKGDSPASLSQLVQRGAIKEEPGETFTLVLESGEVATFTVGTLRVDVRRAQGRFPRLPIDARALVLLVIAFLAVGLIVLSVLAPSDGPRLEWLKKR